MANASKPDLSDTLAIAVLIFMGFISRLFFVVDEAGYRTMQNQPMRK
jgi:hypothetical protein